MIGELAYLLLHDPDYRWRVRISDLVQAGKQVRLKHHINHLSKFLPELALGPLTKKVTAGGAP